jgi:hypothetical protein
MVRPLCCFVALFLHSVALLFCYGPDDPVEHEDSTTLRQGCPSAPPPSFLGVLSRHPATLGADKMVR